MDEKRGRKYREKVKCYICKKMFNSDYKDKHSETGHNGKKSKTFICTRRTITFTPKWLRTKEHIFEGRLTAKSGSLADNCIGNENLVEPGYNSEDDKHVICNDNDSTPLPNKSSDNVEDNILLQILTTTKATMTSFTNLNQSSQIAR